MVNKFFFFYEVILILLCIFFPLILGFNLVSLSFFINSLAISFFLFRIFFVNKNESLPISAMVTFYYFFYIIAPVLQINASSLRAVNTVQINDSLIVQANIIIFLFLILFLIFYEMLKPIFLTKKPNLIIDPKFEFYLRRIFIILSGIISVYAIIHLTSIFFGSTKNLEDSNNLLTLIRGKVIFMLPFLTIGIVLLTPKIYVKNYLWILVFLIICLIITKNPILDRRNALGPVYLSLIFLFLIRNNLFKRNYFFHITFFSLGLLFPMSALLTHYVLYEDRKIFFTQILFDHFYGLHYDAWSSIIATIEYVNTFGIQLGNQLLGTVLFYVPRIFWETKPSSTATEVGNYLMDSSSLWFNNISISLPAEGFIDFGYLGLVIMAFLLALFVLWIEYLSLSPNKTHKIASIFLSLQMIFILRGSLLPAFAYTIGALITLLAIPIFTLKIILFLKRSTRSLH